MQIDEKLIELNSAKLLLIQKISEKLTWLNSYLMELNVKIHKTSVVIFLFLQH